METVKGYLFDWLNKTFNDYYIVQHPGISLEGFIIVNHSPKTDNQQFWQLLVNMFPCLETEYCLWVSQRYGNSISCRKIICSDGDIILRPYDNEICHTKYVKPKEKKNEV